MENQQRFPLINKDKLLSKTEEMKNDGYFLTQICALKKEKFDLLYSFEKGYEMTTFRVEANENDEIQSINKIFTYAFLYENEMKDLFGVKIVNLDLDFKGHFYKTTIKTPFNVKNEE